MKKIALAMTLAGLLLSAGVASAQKTENIYMIDGETVASFNGSQLEGKFVTDYDISTESKQGVTVVTHRIRTAGGKIGRQIRINADSLRLRLQGAWDFFEQLDGDKVLLELNGKLKDLHVLDSLDLGKIQSFSYIKEHPTVKWDRTEPRGTIRIVTRDDSRKIIFVDGKRIDSEVLSDIGLTPGQIESLVVLQPGNEEAKKYGPDVTVIRISTKKQNR